MRWTNKGSFPEAIVKAITNDSYSKGNADFSVTELISPAQIKVLQKLHANQLTKDVSENIWLLLGTAVHYILEQATGHPLAHQVSFRMSQLEDIKSKLEDLEVGAIPAKQSMTDIIMNIIDRQPPMDSAIETEFRASINLGGYIISGAVDWYDKDNLIIEDYKVVTVWKFMHGDWEDYIKQLNMYKYLFAENGRPAKTLKINAIFKDWKARELGRDNYPEYAVKQIDIPVWDSLDTLQYILDRLKLHSAANKCKTADELAEKFPCSDEERWATKSWAIKKKGGKNASWKFDKIEDAHEKFKTINAIEYEIEDRSTFKRCEEYCDVSIFCKQYRKDLPKVHLGDAPRGIIKGETRPELIVKDDFGPELRGENKSIEETRDAKVIVSDTQEEHIATITAVPKPEKKLTTEDLMATLKKKTDVAVAKVNEEYGYEKPKEEVVIKSESKEQKKDPDLFKVDPDANLGSILDSIGL